MTQNSTQLDSGPSPTRPVALALLDLLLAVAAAVAVSALALEHGFYKPLPTGRGLLHAVELGVLAVFVIDRLLRWRLSPRPSEFIKCNWFDLALMLAAGVAAAAVTKHNARIMILSGLTAYVVISQIYNLGGMVVRTVADEVRRPGDGTHPLTAMLGGFVVLILVGAGLLMLPRAAPPGRPIAISDALFTSTSAVCLTGLGTLDTGADFTRLGQWIIMILFQLGGLGMLVLGTLLAMTAGHGLSLRESLLPDPDRSDAPARIGRLLKWVVAATFIVEAVAAGLMYPMWAQGKSVSVGEAAFASAFHAISAFCNAGFALPSGKLASVRDNWQVIGVIAPLIVLGGLGAPVLFDLARAVKDLFARRGDNSGRTSLATHTKLVLLTTAVLLVVGAMGLIGIEWVGYRGITEYVSFRADDSPRPLAAVTQPALTRLPGGEQAREAFMQSAAARSGGLSTVSMSSLSEGGKLWMCLLMLVGGSPAGTAGGIKTVTLALLVLSGWSVLRRRQDVIAFGRGIGWEYAKKAAVLAGLYLSVVVVITLLLCVTMGGQRLASRQEATFMQLFFEACSACANVGLSCDVTSHLTVSAKAVVMLAMFVGRVGPLALLVWLTRPLQPSPLQLPEAELML